MKPRLAITLPPAPSYISSVPRHHLVSSPRTYLKAFTHVSSVDGKRDKHGSSENPECSRDGQLVELGLQEPITVKCDLEVFAFEAVSALDMRDFGLPELFLVMFGLHLDSCRNWSAGWSGCSPHSSHGRLICGSSALHKGGYPGNVYTILAVMFPRLPIRSATEQACTTSYGVGLQWYLR